MVDTHGDGAHLSDWCAGWSSSNAALASGAVVVAAQLRPGRLQRQRAEVDAGDAGPGDRAGRLSSLSAFRYARAVGCGPRLAPPPAVLPERRGIFILDGTSFPKQGPALGRCRTPGLWRAGKIANCRVAATAALWTGVRAWFLGATLYLPEEWLTPPARQRARIPTAVRFQEKWRQALRLLRQVRASGLPLTAVLGDAEFGDVTVFRAALHRLRLPYAVGISSHLTVFRDAAAHGHARRRDPTGRPARPDGASSPRPLARSPRGPDRANGPDGVATSHLAQRHATPTSSPLHRSASNPGERVAPSAISRPRSGCSANRRPAANGD